MGFSEGVQWWEEWQLRLLVLASLFLQYFLFLGALLRKGRIPSWFRSLIWLAYHSCDLVVIYALATLFNQSKVEELAAHHGSTTHLGALWASILLLHLGGQDGLTAYGIEDNENWKRQFLIAVSQITVVIYVLRKSWWSDDVKLLRAAIVLFVPGVLKCLEKPWALKHAAMASIMSSPDSRMETTLKKDDTLAKDKIVSLDKYLKEAARMVKGWMVTTLKERMRIRGEAAGDDKGADEPYHLFADVGHPYIIRLRNLELMLPRGTGNVGEVHDLVRASLSKAFDRFYTKRRRSTGKLRRLLRAVVVVVLPFAGVGLFQLSRRDAYDRADVAVTYVLLCCTAALELISACFVRVYGLPLLDDQMDQYNLIGHLARNKEHQWVTRLAGRLGCKKALQLDRLWRMELPEPSTIVTKLVYDHVVVHGWKEYVKPGEEIVFDDAMGYWMCLEGTAVGAYRRFNDRRGQGAIAREKGGFDDGDTAPALMSSFRVPFDESLVLWHLATEFCYFEHADTGSDAAHYSRVISNYMAYLLLVNPDMVVPGARRGLIVAARHELQTSAEHRVELEPTEVKLVYRPMTKDDVARRIIRNVKGTSIDVGSDGLVHRAWALAYELMEFARKKAEKEMKEKMDEYEKQKKLREEEEEEEKRQQEEEKRQREEEKRQREEEKRQPREEEKKKKRREEEEDDEEEMEKRKVEMEMIRAEDEKRMKEEERMEEVRMEENKRRREEDTKKKIVFQAKMDGDDKMWKVIQDVWVEMLCFSAGRCRGHLHAKSLGNGGEYLSYVWLLLSYMGMETMPERTQRPELPVEGDTGARVEHQQDEMALKTNDTVNRKAHDTSNYKKTNLNVQNDASSKSPQQNTSSHSRTTKLKPSDLVMMRPTATASVTAVTPIVGDDNV